MADADERTDPDHPHHDDGASTQAGDAQHPRSGLTYAGSGVDVDAGDRFANSIQRAMRMTHGPRVLANEGGFAGLLRLDFNEQLFKRNFRDPVLVACTDGVGTKILLAKQLGDWSTVGQDLVAMNVNDLVVQGAEPILFLDYIACHAVEPDVLSPIVEGVAAACRAVGAALLGGETAELNDLYRPGDVDLAGFALGVLELERAIDPDRVEPGDVVIGLESDGVHSNGFSLVRRIVDHAGLDLHARYHDPAPDARDADQTAQATSSPTLGEVLLRPTRLYAGPIVRLLRKYKVKKIVSGMAHITGGGLAGNLRRALHAGVDAHIAADAWPVPPIFPFLQHHGAVDDHEMATAFNMGVGYVLIVRPSFAQSVSRHLEDLGERPHVIGRIVKGAGDVHFT
jgi:phosphoribosylformylglycinamidine cyclo-ligase